MYIRQSIITHLVLGCIALNWVAGIIEVSGMKGLEASANSRNFSLTYAATIKHLPPGRKVRVWIPSPTENSFQQINLINSSYPARTQLSVEPKYGNQIQYFETIIPSTGKISFESTYAIVRHEVAPSKHKGNPQKIRLPKHQRELFLAPNTLVPLAGKHDKLLRDMPLTYDSLAQSRWLYNRVGDYLTYDKRQAGYGHGDVLWTCDSRCGNCSDFHSLFIALARMRGIPARFEIGFPLPLDRSEGPIVGYHCWASFFIAGTGWIPVDISSGEKHPELRPYYFGNLSENRVAFTTGRDIKLVPKQAGKPLNFFIYPHAEVDRQPILAEQIEWKVTFADL
jgi:transglutaminase-like putative cysteine protease